MTTLTSEPHHSPVDSFGHIFGCGAFDNIVENRTNAWGKEAQRAILAKAFKIAAIRVSPKDIDAFAMALARVL